MWQAYYAKDNLSLAKAMVQMIRRQFGTSYFDAARTAKLLADSAKLFKAADSGSYEVALPPLIAAYRRIQRHCEHKFDPQQAAAVADLQ